MKYTILLATLALAFTAINAANPGAVVALRQAALTNLKDAIVPWLNAQVKNINIPNQDVSGIHFDDIHLTEFNIPAASTAISLQQGQIKVTSSAISLYVRGEAEKETPFGKLKDGFGVSTGDGYIEEAVAASISSNGSLVFSIPSAQVKISHLDFHVDGWLGHLADQILEQLSDQIEDSLNPQLTKSIKEATQEALDKITEDNSDTVEVSDVPIEIDFTPDITPNINPQYASLGLDGSIIPNTTKQRPPFQNTVTLPQIDANDNNDAQIFVSEYMLDSALWSLSVTNFLQYFVTNSSLPSNTPVALDTTSLFILFPNLTKQYGEGQLVELNCSVVDGTWPDASITPGNLTVTGKGQCHMYAENSTTKEYQYVLTMEAEIDWEMNATVNEAKYEIVFDLITIFVKDMQVVNSTIGTVNNLLLQDKFNAVLVICQPIINGKLAKHPLPLPKISQANITNPRLYIQQGYLEVTATPLFNPFTVENVAPEPKEDIFEYVGRIFY